MAESAVKRYFFSGGLFFWVAVGALALYFILPLREKLRFGIDLVGGTYLTLEVQTEKAVEADLIQRMQDIESTLSASGLTLPEGKKVEKNKITLTFNSVQETQAAASLLRTSLGDLTMSSEGQTLVLTLPDRIAQDIKRDAVERNIEVLRTRVDKLGVADIPIAVQGEKNIVIELPDVSDPQQAKAMIGTAAQLEFRLVEKFDTNKENLLLEYDGELPDDVEILPGKNKNEYYLVTKFAEVSGKHLKDARPSLGGQTGVEAVVSFTLTDEGGQKFYDLTSANYGRPLAIVLDNVVISAPRINEAIRNQGQISGQFSSEQARELAMLLKSGAFVAPVTFEEERQIGPSLGAESIRQGLLSCLVGLGLLFIFSLFYYQLSGLFAFVALIYNLILILAGMAWLGATLTLPGIAGMVLTVGMAIDASILIYERIKEELSKGNTLKDAVNKGFSGAMKVILDANITTFIVGVVLYKFGTGPIQGFAVTMMLGIVATLITGLFFLRSLFVFIINNFSVQKLKF